jgi:hypothetical protein
MAKRALLNITFILTMPVSFIYGLVEYSQYRRQIINSSIIVRGTRWHSSFRHSATSRKVASSIPDGVTGMFHWHNPSGPTMTLGLTQPLTEMSKGIAIPLQAWIGSEWSRSLKLQYFKTFGTWRWQGCRPYAPATFNPRKYSWYSFMLEDESIPGP